jgi:hypothetical protein
LLLAVQPDREPALIDALATRGVAVRSVVGRITEADAPGRIQVA